MRGVFIVAGVGLIQRFPLDSLRSRSAAMYSGIRLGFSGEHQNRSRQELGSKTSAPLDSCDR